jgi:hypothetical protein
MRGTNLNPGLEGAILGRLALHYPEPIEAQYLFLSTIQDHSETEGFAESLRRLIAAGLVKLTSRPGWPQLTLTSRGVEFAQQLMEEAMQIVRRVEHANDA